MNFHKKIFITIAITAALYLIGCIWAGWDSIVEAMAKFQWWLIPVCLCLAIGNYVIRFCKWHYYLTLLNIPLNRLLSFQVFLAGMVMSATPGKFGEVFKSYLVKNINRTPFSHSAPIVLAERLTDFMAFLILAMLGVTLLPNGPLVFGISIGIVLLILVLVSWKWAAEGILSGLSKLPFFSKHSEKIRSAYESTYYLIAPKPLFLATLISVVSWFLECIAFYLILTGFDHSLPLVHATFIYAFATILGALLMTPGGVGPTEGSMAGLLILLSKVPEGIAASATLLIRLCTLWFGVAVGMAVLTLRSHKFDPDELLEDETEFMENP